jgi:lipopolysaccharide biosynthesis protein
MDNNKIIVFFHIYYTDLLDEYLWFLNNIKKSNYDFDLYVSICNDVLNDEINKKLTDFKSNVIITICNNKGADIGGFFHTIRNTKLNFKDLSKYCACMYLHTKQSRQHGMNISYTWRGQLLNDTLISPDLVNFCVDKIKNKTGIIGSNRCIFSINNSFKSYKKEEEYYKNLCRRLKLNINKSYFVAGTIFWINLEIINFIINSDITPNDFNQEFSHFGQLEHGFERIFGNISTELKLPIIGINLDIKSEIYHETFKLFNEIYNNYIIFKIDNNIILPNENEIVKYRLGRLNTIKKLLIFNTV